MKVVESVRIFGELTCQQQVEGVAMEALFFNV